jgi:solute carrier family 45 protein 1/2/4
MTFKRRVRIDDDATFEDITNWHLLQVIVSLGSGPWDQMFGGGNAPAFAVAAGSSFIGGLVAILGLPRARIASSSSRRRGGTHR